jgi:hypothetical protein
MIIDRKRTFQVFILVILSMNGINSFAQHGHKEDKPHNEGHENLKHHIALFNGATTNLDHSSTNYSLGLEYEFKLNSLIGLGLMGEYVAVEKGELVGGIPVFIHITKAFTLTGSPVLINYEKHHEGSQTDSERETHIAFRTGISYSFHMGALSLSPIVNYEIGETQSLVYGINIGIGF